MRIILASQSPRRRELLSSAGIQFEAVTAEAEESFDPAMSPEDLCEHNASAKSAAVEADYPDACIIGADTLVFLDGHPLGKPADENQARETLRKLSGRTHLVCTGVSLRMPSGEHVFSVKTRVTFRPLDEDAISRYMKLVDVMDKAGAYAFQEHGEMIVSGINGDRDNVIGLPVTILVDRLRACGCL